MTVTMIKTKDKLKLEIDPDHFENFLDLAGFYQPSFLKALRKSDQEIKKGHIKKRKSLMDICDD